MWGFFLTVPNSFCYRDEEVRLSLFLAWREDVLRVDRVYVGLSHELVDTRQSHIGDFNLEFQLVSDPE